MMPPLGRRTSNLEAVEFIERHRNEPFFLYKSHYAVHTRLDGRPDLVAKYEAKPSAGYICLQTEAAECWLRRFELWPLGEFKETWKAE